MQTYAPAYHIENASLNVRGKLKITHQKATETQTEW